MSTRNTQRTLLLFSLLAAWLVLTPACRSPGPGTLNAAFEGVPAFAWQEAPTDDEQGAVEDEDEAADDDGHGIGWHLLMYVPNRVFDVFDIVRARVKLGPGFAVGVRATDAVDLNLGTYATIWVGLHGHRGKPSIPWPFGLETFTGAEISVVETSITGDAGPNYGPVEFGANVHALLVGVDVGIEPLEILDLVAGLLFIDLTGDDY